MVGITGGDVGRQSLASPQDFQPDAGLGQPGQIAGMALCLFGPCQRCFRVAPGLHTQLWVNIGQRDKTFLQADMDLNQRGAITSYRREKIIK